MGQETNTQSEFSENSSLIDFLYVDKERVDSLISQLREGTLRSVTKTIGTSEGSSLSVKGSAAGILSGNYKHNNISTGTAAEQYDPYHGQLLKLLNDLSIPPLSQLPPIPCAGRLVVLESPIKIRDLHSSKALMPLVTKNFTIFKIPQNKELRTTLKLMNDMIQVMDDSIELSLPIFDTLINGTLREGCLTIKPADLNRTYGIELPGTWYTLGILDSIALQDDSLKETSSLEDFIDICSASLNQMYSTSQYSIIPIMIYRVITY